MKKYVLALTLISGLVGAYPVTAGQASYDLGYCINDNMTGKERKMLAKWMFFGMSAHPEIKPYANVSESDMDNSNKFVADLVTRLLTRDCFSEARTAIKKEGGTALQGAFQLVGSTAVEELSSNADVARSMSSFEKYLSQEKLNSIFVE